MSEGCGMVHDHICTYSVALQKIPNKMQSSFTTNKSIQLSSYTYIRTYVHSYMHSFMTGRFIVHKRTSVGHFRLSISRNIQVRSYQY